MKHCVGVCLSISLVALICIILPGIDGIYPSTESNIYGNNVTQLSFFLPHEAKRFVGPRETAASRKVKSLLLLRKQFQCGTGDECIAVTNMATNHLDRQISISVAEEYQLFIPGNDGGFVTVGAMFWCEIQTDHVLVRFLDKLKQL